MYISLTGVFLDCLVLDHVVCLTLLALLTAAHKKAATALLDTSTATQLQCHTLHKASTPESTTFILAPCWGAITQVG